MTLTELAERLPQRFRLLRSARGGAARHRSLDALVAWSFDQLTAPEQRFFARLSVFLGEFDLPAAHAVAGEDDADDLESLALLDALVDKSLVISSERRGRSRYSLLETLRQFGDAHVGDTGQEVRERHARYYTTLIADLKRQTTAKSSGSLIELIEAEFPNIRAAFQFARSCGQADLCLHIVGELATFAQLHPSLEVAEWADQALALSSGSVSPQTVRAHLAAGSALHFLADWRGAERHARAALADDERLGGSMRASALAILAPPVAYLGRPAEAYALAQDAVARAEVGGRHVIIAATRAVCMHCSVYAEIVPTTEELATLRGRAESSGGPAELTYAADAYGMAALMLGEPEAVPALRMAAAAADEIGARHVSCLSRSYLALAEGEAEPHLCLRALRVALVEYGVARIPFGPRQVAAELLHFFARLHRWSTIAVLDGATPPVSIFPDAARQAKEAARRELGDAAFEAGAARGRRMLHDEFESFLHAELDLLGVDQYTSTLPD